MRLFFLKLFLMNQHKVLLWVKLPSAFSLPYHLSSSSFLTVLSSLLQTFQTTVRCRYSTPYTRGVQQGQLLLFFVRPCVLAPVFYWQDHDGSDVGAHQPSRPSGSSPSCQRLPPYAQAKYPAATCLLRSLKSSWQCSST